MPSRTQQSLDVSLEKAEVELGIKIRVIFPKNFPLERAQVQPLDFQGVSEPTRMRVVRSMAMAIGGAVLTKDGSEGYKQDDIHSEIADTATGSVANPPQTSSSMRSPGTQLASALALFTSSLSKELQGVEPCPICYSLVSSGLQVIPNKKCVHCKKAFHSECLTKWFLRGGQASVDRSCPLCRQAFYRGGAKS